MIYVGCRPSPHTLPLGRFKPLSFHMVGQKIAARLLSWKLVFDFLLGDRLNYKEYRAFCVYRQSWLCHIQFWQFTFTVFSQLNLPYQLRVFTVGRPTHRVLSASVCARQFSASICLHSLFGTQDLFLWLISLSPR